MTSRWYDLDHNPIRPEEAERLWADPRRIIGKDRVDGWEVSTVFLILDHGWGTDGPPVLYETMVFCPLGHATYDAERWTTREQAIAGHDQILAAVRDGERGCQEGHG